MCAVAAYQVTAVLPVLQGRQAGAPASTTLGHACVEGAWSAGSPFSFLGWVGEPMAVGDRVAQRDVSCRLQASIAAVAHRRGERAFKGEVGWRASGESLSRESTSTSSCELGSSVNELFGPE